MDLSDPQAWTMIGIFASAMLGGMTLMTTQFSRVLRAEIGGLRGELGGEIGGLRGELGGEIGGLRGEIGGLRGELGGEISGLRGEIGGLRGEIDVLRTEMRAGFEVMNVRLDSLDTRLTRVEGKVDDLDTELTHLATRFWRSQ
jgi:hypothetical protein